MSATLTLEEAARLLQLHPTTLAAKARSGEIPGAKPGKRWVFVEVDLVEYVRSHYDAKTRLTGGSKSPTVDSAYSKALGLQTGKKPGSTTTS
jgi:excisionase family DNA binding protein